MISQRRTKTEKREAQKDSITRELAPPMWERQSPSFAVGRSDSSDRHSGMSRACVRQKRLAGLACWSKYQDLTESNHLHSAQGSTQRSQRNDFLARAIPLYLPGKRSVPSPRSNRCAQPPEMHATLCFARIKSAFKMNNIQRADVTLYTNSLHLHAKLITGF